MQALKRQSLSCMVPQLIKFWSDAQKVLVYPWRSPRVSTHRDVGAWIESHEEVSTFSSSPQEVIHKAWKFCVIVRPVGEQAYLFNLTGKNAKFKQHTISLFVNSFQEKKNKKKTAILSHLFEKAQTFPYNHPHIWATSPFWLKQNRKQQVVKLVNNLHKLVLPKNGYELVDSSCL